ncbi:hypothetical protein P875_00127563 [Aspergillus parasiticus SU-1]|uniref:Uncharacterized protein n=1 Tax=Aspergillus parasiticus (strain ATCC 56775 / NRRL 5862 / SRRC 143 / SU-1) TaxID=1403190 RepID=A0A0F0IMH7_ASPPU|nr:hypothetical protein P875_00127563 [Aspergillus parasiticus SU-1]
MVETNSLVSEADYIPFELYGPDLLSPHLLVLKWQEAASCHCHVCGSDTDELLRPLIYGTIEKYLIALAVLSPLVLIARSFKFSLFETSDYIFKLASITYCPNTTSFSHYLTDLLSNQIPADFPRPNANPTFYTPLLI